MLVRFLVNVAVLKSCSFFDADKYLSEQLVHPGNNGLFAGFIFSAKMFTSGFSG